MKMWFTSFKRFESVDVNTAPTLVTAFRDTNAIGSQRILFEHPSKKSSDIRFIQLVVSRRRPRF